LNHLFCKSMLTILAVEVISLEHHLTTKKFSLVTQN
jgi:hypothetical protein